MCQDKVRLAHSSDSYREIYGKRFDSPPGCPYNHLQDKAPALAAWRRGTERK